MAGLLPEAAVRVLLMKRAANDPERTVHRRSIKAMSDTQKIPWLRLSVEAVAIVGSILLAFAIDAWWDSRSDQKQERALLIALSADFAATEQEFAEVKTNHDLVTRAGNQLITYGEAGTVPESEQADYDILVSAHFSRFIFDPPMGTVESVLSSGRFHLLTNERLVAELTQWSAIVAELRFSEIDARNHFNERIFPFLASRFDVEDLDKVFPQFVDFPWEQGPTGAYKLASDQEFQNIVYMHWVHSMNIVAELEVVERSLERIQKLIEVELSE
jgi:hypothetical protein